MAWLGVSSSATGRTDGFPTMGCRHAMTNCFGVLSLRRGKFQRGNRQTCVSYLILFHFLHVGCGVLDN
ncbi:hypothetical protein PAHAL_5G027200 [Panicum hallii]|uniref:Uncharacterized protein n=1 Tax=Panicum hallii TaxID=206008 RepID=A0A2T8IIR7_9POAL|nr:hypothetical protein PAHAL_5G027200 [Panicum hallii]